MTTNTKLFEVQGAQDLSGTICAGWSTISTDPNTVSAWHAPAASSLIPPTTTLYRDVVKAVQDYVSAEMEAGHKQKHVAILRVSDDEYSCEVAMASNGLQFVDVVVLNTRNHVLEAAHCKSATFEPFHEFGNGSNESAEAIFVLLLHVIKEQNAQLDADLEVVKGWWPNRLADDGSLDVKPEVKTAMYRICDAVYYGLVRSDNDFDKKFVTSLTVSGGVSAVQEQDVKAHAYDGIPEVGTPMILQGRTIQLNGPVTLEQAIEANKKRRDAFMATLTEAEKADIPELPMDTVVPQWVLELNELMYATENAQEPVNNVRIEGATSEGKSFGTQLLCEIRGQPYTSQNLDPDVDKLDMKQQVTAATEQAEEAEPVVAMSWDPAIPNDHPVLLAFRQPRLDLALKDAMNAILDSPETASRAMFGRPNKNCTEVVKMFVSWWNVYHTPTKKPASQFVRVNSELMRGLKGPYIVELQEMSRARPGVLSGLNEVFDRHGTIHLEATGETFKRHPKSIIVSTDNVGYAGCKPISPDVRRRFSCIIRLDGLSKEDAVARAMQRTKFTNKAMLNQMWDIICEVKRICREKDITAGDIGLSELINWALQVKLGFDKKQSFNICVLTKATGDAEEEKEVKRAVELSVAVKTFFA